MFEWLPVLGGTILGTGTAFFDRTVGKTLTVAGIAMIAMVATVSSGEAERSWAYYAIDLVQTAIGFGIGFFGIAWLRRKPSPR